MNKRQEISPDFYDKNVITGQPEELNDTVMVNGKEMSLGEYTKMTEKQIEKKKTRRIHFQWSDEEYFRCKRLAEKKGLKYQTYIKSILKQAMDLEDAG